MTGVMLRQDCHHCPLFSPTDVGATLRLTDPGGIIGNLNLSPGTSGLTTHKHHLTPPPTQDFSSFILCSHSQGDLLSQGVAGLFLESVTPADYLLIPGCDKLRNLMTMSGLIPGPPDAPTSRRGFIQSCSLFCQTENIST